VKKKKIRVAAPAPSYAATIAPSIQVVSDCGTKEVLVPPKIKTVTPTKEKKKIVLLGVASSSTAMNENTPPVDAKDTTIAGSKKTNEVMKPKPKKKRKKKKFSDILSGIMAAKPTTSEGTEKTEEEIRKEHAEKLRKSLGGGNFRKVDKI